MRCAGTRAQETTDAFAEAHEPEKVALTFRREGHDQRGADEALEDRLRRGTGRIAADIDELAIYTTALTATQILAHYEAATAPEVVIPEPATIAIWMLLGMVGLLGYARRRKPS